MSTELTAASATTTGTETTTVPAAGLAEQLRKLHLPVGRGRTAWRRIRQSGILLALIALIVVGALLSDHFFEFDNLVNVSRQTAIVGLLGIGMTFVILTAGIDLSVGSIVGFSAIAFASAMENGSTVATGDADRPRRRRAGRGDQRTRHHQGTTAAVHHDPRHARHRPRRDDDVRRRQADPARRPGRLVRLARHRRAGSGCRCRCGSSPCSPPSPPSSCATRQFGRHVYAVGDNLEAARLSGINTNRVIFAVYVISGFCAAMTALIIVSRLTAGEPSQGTGFELDAIAIVVIGGTSLFGGEGGIGGTLIGAAIVAVIANLLNLLGVSPFSQQIVKGLIILGAVLLERQTAGRRREQ